jgi:hypothetical protein
MSLPVSSAAQRPVLDVLEGALQDLLGDPHAAGAVPKRTAPRGRPPILPATVLWAGLLVCILRGFSAQLQLWRLLTLKGLWRFPKVALTDMAIYKRLERAGPEAMQAFFAQVTQAVQERFAAEYAHLAAVPYAAFATAIVALDHTKLDPVLRKLKVLRAVPAGAVELLPGALASLFDVRSQQWLKVVFQPEGQHNVKFGVEALVEGLPKGTLLLFDLGYFAFPWFDQLTAGGYYWISRMREKATWETLHTFCDHTFAPGSPHAVRLVDRLVYLGAYRADRAAHPARLLEITTPSGTYRYLTNVLDPRRLPAAHVAALYRRRWNIEMAFNLLKTHLGLHLLWSAHRNVLLQQVFGTLIVAQVALALRTEVAQRANCTLAEVSLPLLLQWLPQLAEAGRDPVAEFVQHGRRVGFIRPFRGREWVLPPSMLEEYTFPEHWPEPRQPRYAQRKCGPRPFTEADRAGQRARRAKQSARNK